MAITDKNILITPNIGQAAEPKIDFVGASATLGPQTITLNVYPENNGTLSFEGSAGQLFSVTNDLTGTIFSVNDVSGIPSIEVLASGVIRFAEFSGNVLVGTATDNGTDKLQISGDVAATTFKGALTGNATTATTLQTTRAINGTNFDGSAAITTANWGTARTITIGGTGKSVNGSGNYAWATSEIAAQTAVTLATTRAINGTNFNGSAAITTANWGTARTITIGSTGKSVNGSANVAWSLAELGAAATAQTMHIGTTAVAINRASAALALTGVSIDGNAGTVGGLSVHTGTNNEVNKIVRTDATGYINAGWINTISGDNSTTVPTRIYASNDGYIRYYTVANFRQVIDVPTRTGGNASGTWSISITGNAASATILQTARTLTIGSTGKTFNGSANVAWSLAEIGAQPIGNYVTLDTPQTITGAKTINSIFTVGTTGNIIWADTAGTYIPRPQGATFKTATAAFTGALSILMPTAAGAAVNDMMSFWVDIYDYAGGNEGESVSIFIYGYLTGTRSWANCGATVISDRTDRDYTVRFGENGTVPVVCIGEISSTWSYPQVIVRDFQAGYTADGATYDDGWSITFLTTLPTVSQTSTANYPVAKSAATLTTARTIGGVSFNGSANINLPGVNATGNQNTTGSAATLTTARTINGVSFNGSANITVTDATKLPLAGGTMTGTITMGTQLALVPSNFGHGVYGVYDPTKYQHVWSMGTSYSLPANGLSTGVGGSLYGLAWSYNPDHGAVGNNAQSKPGLNHQLLLMQNGTTTFAAGSGIWTSGTVTAPTFSGALTGNASTATTLQTARTIGGVSFNGSANINLPGVNATGNQNTTGSAATLTTARTINGVSFNGSANITVADATKLPTAGGTMTGLLVGRNSTNTDVNTANDGGSFSVRGSTTTVAAISFHRAGAFAINMGLGTDNVFRIGGWSASNNAFQMTAAGALTMLGDVTAFSDIRLKDNIRPIPDALTKILNSRGVIFTRTDQEDRERVHIGVIAQEIEKYFPEIVLEDTSGIKSVNYGAMAGAFIEAIKEQQAQIDKLELLVKQLLNTK